MCFVRGNDVGTVSYSQILDLNGQLQGQSTNSYQMGLKPTETKTVKGQGSCRPKLAAQHMWPAYASVAGRIVHLLHIG